MNKLLCNLDYMRLIGSSISLNWGEDNNMWECSWIVDGKRHTSFDLNITEAINKVLGVIIENESKI